MNPIIPSSTELRFLVEGCMSNSWRRGMRISQKLPRERVDHMLEQNKKETDLIMDSFGRHVESECDRRIREFAEKLVLSFQDLDRNYEKWNGGEHLEGFYKGTGQCRADVRMVFEEMGYGDFNFYGKEENEQKD